MASTSKANRILFRVVRLLLVALIIFYAAACLLVFTFQRKLLYLPVVRSVAEVDQMAKSMRMERWTNVAGEFIGMKRLATTAPAIGRVLMFYGNASSAVRCSVYADVIQQIAPLDFFVMEYPGYEDRRGAPSRASLIAAATDALQSLGTNGPLYLIGESLGTGAATFVAGQFPARVNGVVLLSPYYRLADVAQYQYPWLPARWLMLDDFQSGNYLHNYRGRVAVMIDVQDHVVPAKFGRRLFDAYNGPKKLWEYPRCQHVELGESPASFWRAVIEFWQTNTPVLNKNPNGHLRIS
jgi:pimeloyl-ACP methyl ester carboxylesterase